MCGICGIVGREAEGEAAVLRAMARRIGHRGPDAEGFHLAEGVALGNRRLEVIDLETGRQPLSNEDGTVWVTFNGEIYNYPELRDELERAGHRFRSRTDTEVLVHLYEEHGVGCVDRLRGMFAFAVWDDSRRTLFAARDRLGQKPFFYAERAGRLYFASEVKSLLAHPRLTAEPEPAAVDYFLTFRFVPPPLTMFRGVQSLPPGHWLSWREGDLEIGRYWSPDFTGMEVRSEQEWLEALRERLRDAVRCHLLSDVPVGALLSGGLDSGIVVALMAEALDEPFSTFCVGSESRSFDERPFARVVAAHVGADHRERCVGPDRLRCLPRIVHHLDAPTDPIAACFFESARLASEEVKVVLGGDGGDEMFAGFDRFAAFRWVGWYARLPRWVREQVVRPAVERLRISFGYKSPAEKARWLATVGVAEGMGERYARMNSYFRFGAEDRRGLYGPGLRSALADQQAELAVSRPFDEAAARDLLHRMIYTDLVTRFPEHTLLLTDRLSMAHGLEARSPLLDDRLTELCAAMPADMKVRGRTTKYALRQVARDYLPPEIVRRPKQGFQFPLAEWLLDEGVLEGVRHSLTAGPLVRWEWVRREALETLFHEHGARRADHHVRIWLLQSLDLWCRMYVEGAEVEELEARMLARPDGSTSKTAGSPVRSQSARAARASAGRSAPS